MKTFNPLPKLKPEFEVKELESFIDQKLNEILPVYASYDVDGCYFPNSPPADG